MKTFKKILSIAVVVCMMISTTGLFQNVDAASVYGNSNSNINNGGVAAYKSGYNYVRSSKPTNVLMTSYNIYKIKGTSSTKKIIANNAYLMPSINVVGNYVYYLGTYNSGESVGIYRVKTDGTGKTRLIGNVESPFIVKDSGIYYIKSTYDYDKLCYYSISSKKTTKTLYTTTTRTIDALSISGNYAYVLATGYENQLIYKIDTNTKSRTTLKKLVTYTFDDEDYDDDYDDSDIDFDEDFDEDFDWDDFEDYDDEEYSIDQMIYYQGYIYYIVSDYDGTEVYKMTADGKNETKITSLTTTSMNLYNGKIYYVNANNSICRMDLNGKNRTTLRKATDTSTKLTLANVGICTGNSRIYYMSLEMGITSEGAYSAAINVYRIKLDGTSRSKI
ncbi:MAG: DUF5050 domain-containing protein [Intestinibacter sp.]|uniref:DUF5050 domain-containing protein n=1 Tax=Intestinibacter sp. TaxID=1965304 RepID=UPI002A816B4C|nr:DUF5050 domain-containing protein [Intestinibacter sp.]MDY4574989.1 DUF5050 domain-containing protein [Intestinibacter sp.]